MYVKTPWPPPPEELAGAEFVNGTKHVVRRRRRKTEGEDGGGLARTTEPWRQHATTAVARCAS
eukprot:SM000436S15712  [mRNA]  locus=s436:29294:32561:+ [translate_table: standard]